MSGIIQTEPFIFEVTIPSPLTFQLPFVDMNNYNCTVDWGDGLSNTITAFDDVGTAHGYVPGTYQISITGFVGGFSFNNSASAQYVTDIIDYGTDTMFFSGAFEGCSLGEITATSHPGITYASDFFKNCDLTSAKVADYDYSCAFGYTSGTFADNPDFNVDISGIRFNSVFTLDAIVQGCSSFNYNVVEWSYPGNLPRTINENPLAYKANAGFGSGGVFAGRFNRMFDSASVYNQDTSSLFISGGSPSVQYMFQNATSFDGSVERSVYNAGTDDEYTSWDVSGITTFTNMFNGADAFNQSLDSWNVTPSGVNVPYMFYSAQSFNNGFPAGVSNGTPGVGFCGWKILNLDYAFAFGATSFNSNISGWDVSSVSKLNATFANASNFNQPIGNWSLTLVGPVSLSSAFLNAISFNNGDGAGVAGGGVGVGMDNWNVSGVTSMANAFNGASSFNQYIGSWDTSSVTSMNRMFYKATSFNQNISGWNTGLVENMAQMFFQTNAFNVNISSWDTSSVTNASSMFREASVFNQNLSSWNLNALTDCSYMFYQSGISDANLEATLYGWSLNPNTANNVNATSIALNRTYAAGSNMDLALNDPTNGLVAAKNWNITGITIV